MTETLRRGLGAVVLLGQRADPTHVRAQRVGPIGLRRHQHDLERLA
jgi:hypothetical protein